MAGATSVVCTYLDGDPACHLCLRLCIPQRWANRTAHALLVAFTKHYNRKHSATSTAAAANGARFICLPECANFLAADKAELRRLAEDETSSQSLACLTELANAHQVFISAGSLMMQADGEDRQANRSYLIGPDGAILARYDKIHMFDADVGDGKRYRESDNFRPGAEIAHCQTDIGHIGLTICYDIRFPGLYRQLGQAGVELITIPAAFTQTTGQAHWHVLQRARAIETGSFVLSSAQCGTHADGRRTYGHSLIVGPWGEVLADAGDTEDGFVQAELNLNEVSAARAALRHLQHQPEYK